MKKVVIVSGVRTPIGRYGGALRDVPVTFIVASLMSMAFLGFSGFKI